MTTAALVKIGEGEDLFALLNHAKPRVAETDDSSTQTEPLSIFEE